MLDVLRPSGEEEPELAPAPGSETSRRSSNGRAEAGIDVALAVEGEPRPLPAGVDLSAYRIVQEALTNVIKHARALHTEVSVRYGASALELSVIDDGTHSATAACRGTGSTACASGSRCSAGRSRRSAGATVAAMRTRGAAAVNPRLRLLIADDQPLMRAAFARCSRRPGRWRWSARPPTARRPSRSPASCALTSC